MTDGPGDSRHRAAEVVSNRPLRVLIAGTNWPPETFIDRLIDGLTAAGVEVTLGTASLPGEPRTGIHWLPTPSWDSPALIRLARLLRMSIRALVFGRSDAPVILAAAASDRIWGSSLRAWNQWIPYAGRRWDVVYFPWNSGAVVHLPIFALLDPVVISCRGTQVAVAPHNPRRTVMREGLRPTFEGATLVHCVSHATAREACHWGLDPNKARIIRPAVSLDVFRPASNPCRSHDKFQIVTTGTLIWIKGHEWALKAAHHLRKLGVDFQFDIIGDGPERQRVLYTVHDLGLEQHVRLLGRQTPEQVLERLQGADVFLLSSLSEGISNAVLEAMACGLPVVTTDCGGMREAVTDGVEGFVVPIRDSEGLAGALLKLASEPLLRQRMGLAARARVERDFDFRHQIRQWLELFQSVAGARGTR